MNFKALVILSGNANGVEVPEQVAKSLGPEARPAIMITINGHTWRSRIARMRGQCLIGISAANRKAAAIKEGEIVEVSVLPDTEPRDVAEPVDLALALNGTAEARIAFDRLPFGLKRRHVASIEEAKSPDTRLRRINKLVRDLAASPKGPHT